MEIFDELDKLEKYGLGNSDYEAFMEKLSDAAKSKINKDESLTAAAIKEAERAGITEVKYKALLDFILNPGEEKAETYIKDIINKYKIAKLSITKTTLRATIEAPEELVKEQKINSIVANYAKLKSKIPLSSLMLLNGKNTPGDAIEKTTFVHSLFENTRSKVEMEYFLKQLRALHEQNPELVENYLNLADTQGKTIKAVILEKSLTERYQNIDQLLPIQRQTRATDVDTHTASIHNSVDISLVHLAKNYLGASSSANNKTINITRDQAWNSRITNDIAEFQNKLIAVTKSDESIEEFIQDTLTSNNNKTEEIAKFKFHAKTTLRMIDAINAGSYGNRYSVDAMSPVTCGLTPKEIAAIGYNSLKDTAKWNNPEQETQHFMNFVEHLYIAKRGYNIDRNGPDEWRTHSNEPDDNKCLGGTINEIANGLTDHKQVEIKIIDATTIKPSLVNKLPDILKTLPPEHINQINQWFNQGIIDENLKSTIIDKLQNDKDFSEPFSKDEITRIGEQVLRKLNRDDSREVIEKAAISITKENNQDHDTLIHNFVYDQEKSYIPYLERLFHDNKNTFKAILNNKLNKNISNGFAETPGSKKTNALLNLLMSSNNEAFTEQVKKVYIERLNELNPDSKNYWLMFAAKDNNQNLIEPMINAGAELNFKDTRHDGQTAIHSAAQHGSKSSLSKLLELGVDPNSKNIFGETAIHYAARHGHIEIITELLEKNIDFNSEDADRSTPLHYAAENGHLDIVTKLLDKNANPNSQNIFGETSLYYAAANGHLEIVTKLLENGANPNSQNQDGESPLYLAVGNGHLEIVTKLLEKSADPNCQNKDYETPLHLAVRNGYLEIVTKLLEKSADPNIANKNGDTPLHYAAFNGHTEVFKAVLGYAPEKKFTLETIEILRPEMIKELKKYQEDPVTYFTMRHQDNPKLLKKIYDKFKKDTINTSNYNSTSLVEALLKLNKLDEQKLYKQISKLRQIGYDFKAERSVVVDSDTIIKTSDHEILKNYKNTPKDQGK